MGIFGKTKGKTEAKKEEKKEIQKNENSGVKLGSVKDFGRSKLLIKQVWITEKASNLSGSGKYIFMVDKSANKPEIKKAIESIYSVNVKGVNVINGKGKAKRLGKSVGRTSEYKKAIVSLKEGQKIDVMPS
jgi:large subunit ribosomal protein L23